MKKIVIGFVSLATSAAMLLSLAACKRDTEVDAIPTTANEIDAAIDAAQQGAQEALGAVGDALGGIIDSFTPTENAQD